MPRLQRQRHFRFNRHLKWYVVPTATRTALPDECEDCNNNGIADECDIAEGTSQDIDENGIPDECQDCNNNGIADYLDIQNGTSYDVIRIMFPTNANQTAMAMVGLTLVTMTMI